MLSIFGELLRRHDADARQYGQHQGQFECAPKRQQELHVEINVGPDAELRRNIAIHAETHEKVDDERQDDEVTKHKAERKERPGEQDQRNAPALLPWEQRRLHELPELIEHDRQADEHRREK